MRTAAWLAMIAITVLFKSQVWAYSTPHDFYKTDTNYKALIFLSHVCPCSKSHVEHLQKLKHNYPNVSFFGVISEPVDPGNQKDVEKYYSDKHFPYPIIIDNNQSLVKKYKALKTPHVTLLKKSNTSYTIVYQGGVSSERKFNPSAKMYLAENLKALHEDKEIKYTNGPSLGCYIRRF